MLDLGEPGARAGQPRPTTARSDAAVATRNVIATMEDLFAGVCIPLVAGEPAARAAQPARRPPAGGLRLRRARGAAQAGRPGGDHPAQLQGLRADEGARPPGRAGPDGRRPGPRDPQPPGRDQGRRPAAQDRAAEAGNAGDAERRGRAGAAGVRRDHRRGGQPAGPRGLPVPGLRAPRPRRAQRAERQRRGAQDDAAAASPRQSEVRDRDRAGRRPAARSTPTPSSCARCCLNLGINALQAMEGRRRR